MRPQFAHKVVYYAAKKGLWIYIGTNGRLLRPDVADRLGDAGASVFNFAVDPGGREAKPAEAIVPGVKRNHKSARFINMPLILALRD